MYNIYKQGTIDGVTPNRRVSKILSILLILYIYVPYFWNICENVFSIPAMVEYVFLLLLGIISIFMYHRIGERVFVFLLTFFLLIAINCAVVSYQYYVFVEGFQAFIGVLVPCVIISNSYFNLDDFLKRWYSFATLNLPLVVIAILLLRLNLAHYSIFTGICVPNVFILSYGIMQMQIKKKVAVIIAIINIIATAALGGRMAAVVCVAMVVLSYLFSSNISLVKKVIFAIVIFILAYYFIENLNSILLWVSRLLSNYGIRSRSVTLMIQQLSTRELYTTNRDTIYSLVIDYIKDRTGLPGGLGVALYLTSGEYYYVHNFLLQLAVVFGIPGALIVVFIIIYKFIRFKNTIPESAFKLLVFMLISYLIIGFTGSSFFIHYLATLFIALFFFGKKVLLEMEG